MRTRSRAHVVVALCTITSVVLTPFSQVLAATPPKPASTAAKPADKGWPRNYSAPSGAQLVFYQPQIASWDGQKHMVAYAAVSYLAKGADKASLGTIKVESDTSVSVENRLVNFAEYKLTEVHFDGVDVNQTKAITEDIEKGIPDGERIIGLDRVMAGVDKSQIIPKNVDGVKADPPTIFYSQKPAVLINLDGDPIWSPIKGNDLKYAINTNWDLFSNEASKTLYLRNTDTWLKASSVNGPWSPAGTLPASFSKLPDDENWKDVKAALPGKPIQGNQVPHIFASTGPAEMILLKGAPSYLLVDGTSDLLWVQNTDSDVFRMTNNGPIYYLVSGRWFSAPDFKGPWTFASTSLPPSFAKIPLEHPRSRVLASVPGTEQAAEAVALAQVPQTARVNRKEVKPPEVKYQGDPKFEQIAPTELARAVNTDKDIIKVGDLYYMCFQGVWFMSRAAAGPWEVTSEVPKAIYDIPVSSPAYNVTYVTVVEDKSDSDWVTFAAVAGYTGMMVAWGCAVWGTGWYYPPYIGYGGYYPIYYPYYRTYGASAWYNPWTGTYGRSAFVYGPYGGVGATARYNPYTGTYSRGAMAYGPYGARGAASAYNPRTGTYAHTRQGSNVYGNWGSSYVQRGDDWAQTGHVTNRATGTTTRGIRTDEGGAVTRRGPNGGGFVAGNGDNMYAGHDGNVYKKNDGGGWSKVRQRRLERRAAARPARRTRSRGAHRRRHAHPRLQQLPARWRQSRWQLPGGWDAQRRHARRRTKAVGRGDSTACDNPP